MMVMFFLISNPNILVKGSMVVRERAGTFNKPDFLGRDFNVLNVYGFTEKKQN